MNLLNLSSLNSALFWSILIRFCQLWSVSPMVSRGRVVSRGRGRWRGAHCDFVSTQDNYPARAGWCVVSILRYSPPSLPHNLECWVQAGIQDCESHIMCYGSQGTRCNVTTPSPGFIKCRKAETCRIFPFSWKNVFFSLHCHSTDVLETWVMILASCQTLPVFYILPHSYLVWLISFLIISYKW